MAERDARQLPHPHRRAWVEVDTGAIRRNLERIRHLVGHGVPVVGRISMDTTVVRILGNTAPGDVVTFLGRDDGTELTLEEVAELAGTTGHQLLTGLSARLPRIRVESW